MKNGTMIEEVRVGLKPGMPYFSEKPITKPYDVAELIANEFQDLDREYIFVVNVDAAHKPINFSIATIGGLANAPCDMGSIFRSAILSCARNILILHNHPSGTVVPSKYDIEFADRVKQAGNIIGIELLDSLIFGGDKVYSMNADKVL